MEPYRSISSLFVPSIEFDAPAAIVGGKQISLKVLRNDVAALSAHLQTCSEQRWLLLSEDAYAIAVGFLAALNAERVVVLPTNLQIGHIAELSDQFDGVLVHEQAVPSNTKALSIFGFASAANIPPLGPFDAEQARVILHTSGTTGEPVPVHKSLTCLENELVVLRGLFKLNSPYVVLATVPAHHIYGLLFRVLWPLVAGQPFAAETLRYPQELEHASRTAERKVLVSSPAFLERALNVVDLDSLKERISHVFSSGGPLSPEVAAAYNAKLARPIVEIYGSTETGGIGYRSTLDASKPEPLMPFPGVTLSVTSDSGNLSVSSPFLHNMQSFQTGDRVNLLPDGRFKLLGRSDRIVKIEERRISLAEVEQKLALQAEVSEARAELLENRSGRKIIGALVVPTSEGWLALARDGKRALTSTLRTGLRPHMDLAAMPRKWRFVRRIPETIQGKTPLLQFRAMFSSAQDQVTQPIVLDRKATSSELWLKLKLPEELKYFDGHFDGHPILAGVIQLNWAIEFAREAFPLRGEFEGIDALKFFRVMCAGEEVTLDLRQLGGKEKLHFRYRSEQHEHSVGRIRFGVAS